VTTATDELIRAIDEQRVAITAHHERVGDTLGELRHRIQALEQKASRRPLGGGATHGTAVSLGDAIVASHDFVGAAPGMRDRRAKFQMAIPRGDFAMITSAPASGGAVAFIDRRNSDPTMLPRQRLTIRDLVAPGSTAGNLVQYPRQTVRNLNANVVSEGALKPESEIAFEMVDAPTRTIAHHTKASRQVWDDAPLLKSAVDGELTYGLQIKEEQELLFGDNTGQHLHGIIPQATAYETGRNAVGDTRFDTLAHALAQSEVALLPATGVVLNNDDLEALKVIKDSEGRYIGGGPFGPPITSIWGRPAVGTPAIDAGEFLVGAFRDGAQVFDRETVNVMISSENEDDFIRNLLTVLCEERLAFAVRRPQAFVHGEFPVAT
jgi:HK97 family phage major capsid protein